AVGAVGVGVRARGAEDRAAAREDPDGALVVELDGLVLEHAGPAAAEADELVAVAQAGTDGGADHRVQAGTVAAAGEHSDPCHRSKVHPGAAPDLSSSHRPCAAFAG